MAEKRKKGSFSHPIFLPLSTKKASPLLFPSHPLPFSIPGGKKELEWNDLRYWLTPADMVKHNECTAYEDTQNVPAQYIKHWTIVLLFYMLKILLQKRNSPCMLFLMYFSFYREHRGLGVSKLLLLLLFLFLLFLRHFTKKTTQNCLLYLQMVHLSTFKSKKLVKSLYSKVSTKVRTWASGTECLRIL